MPQSATESDEYTPTTEEIREYIMVGDPKPWEAPSPEVDARESQRGAAFDRWLAEHDRQVARANSGPVMSDHRANAEALDIALYGKPDIYTPPEEFMPRRATIAEKLAELYPDLTAQVQAAQATIVEALAASYEPWPYSEQTALNVQGIREILRRADTSAHDAAILAAKAGGWERGRNETIMDRRPPLTAINDRANPYRVGTEVQS